MKKIIIFSIGYQTYAVPEKPGIAGKLIDLLSNAVPVDRDFSSREVDRWTFDDRPRPISVEIVKADQVLPPVAIKQARSKEPLLLNGGRP
jgi:hypothetical protein